MKERFHRFKFKMDVDQSRKPKMVIYPNEKNQLVYKMVDKDNQEIESILFEIEGFYVGKNNPNKVLFSQPVHENQLITNVDAELARYDVILVVDTSYDPFSKPNTAITSIKICNILDVEDAIFKYQCTSYLLEWDATSIDKQENFMYSLAIELLRDKYEELNEYPETAVIVDSDLQNIPSYNDRTKPIFNNYFLPEGFYIFYASSDRGNEYFQNKLLKICDKEAKKALVEYKKTQLPTSYKTS